MCDQQLSENDIVCDEQSNEGTDFQVVSLRIGSCHSTLTEFCPA